LLALSVVRRGRPYVDVSPQTIDCFSLSRGARSHRWARRIESYAPKPGDLVHVNRDDGTVDYDRISGGPYAAESGIVVESGQGEARIVMGNQEPMGSVGTEKLALDDSGLLIQRGSNPFICVIEVRK
jgi:hypothetical protein